MSDKKGVKIEKIVINIDGKKLELTKDQANELRFILDEMYGNATHYYPHSLYL